MRFSGLLWWLGAFVFAAIAGVLTLSVLARQTPAGSEALSQSNTTPVVVAAIDVPFRRSIGESELVIRELPIESVPEGAATTLDQVVGKMSSVDIFASEPILVQQLVTPDIVTQQVALSVPEGKIVTVVPTDSKLISNRLLRPGDKIDLFATFDIEVVRVQGSGPMAESVSMLQNLEVHAIILPTTILDEESDNDGGVFQTADEEGQSMLLAVEPQDALAIRHILDVDGKIDVGLRAPDDESLAETTVVDQFYLANRYQIDLVRDAAEISAQR